MLQPGGKLDLPEEPLGAQAGGHFGMENLERDRPVVLEIAGEVNRRHPSAADFALEPITIGQPGRK